MHRKIRILRKLEKIFRSKCENMKVNWERKNKKQILMENYENMKNKENKEMIKSEHRRRRRRNLDRCREIPIYENKLKNRKADGINR